MESVFRGAAIYVIMLIVVRLSGRRTLSQLTAFDFVLLLIVAETTQQALLGDDFSISNAVILILTLFGIDILLSHVKRHLPLAGIVIDGTTTVLISKGEPDWRAMARARVQIGDVLEAARIQHGLARLDQIDFAVLEASGNISIIPAGAGK
ncbi:DUF421 domain-containing protein [Pelagibacterium xiamenense]|uniref:DUF421 domain-containing protein n=1 Tax=Pelagibacterium xiamenense TaxID=2901140 RepID=UPI001E4E4D1F|nr:YetF domain-containing protein [Pelagibacterium xiamenense]MCD7059003.1 DUF421 domain-containing protein [Pelagibacterium xiamenense]